MAQVQTVEAPSVQQSGAPLGINPPAEAFGAQVNGAGMQQFGQAAGQASDILAKRAETLQALNNKAEADKLGSDYTSAAIQAREKWATSPDGAGINAQRTLPDQLTTQEQLRQQFASNASNPMAKSMFDEYSRRLQTMNMGAMATHAAAEGKKYRLEAYDGAQKTAQDLLASSPDLFFDHSPGSPMSNLVQSQVARDIETGAPEEAHGVALKELLGKTAGYVTESLVKNGKVDEGTKFLDRVHADGTIGGVQYQETLARIAPAVMKNQAFADADKAVTAALSSTYSTAKLGLPASSLGALTQAQADAFNTNPGKFIGDILGTGPLQVNSQHRTLAQELALPGGTASSEHVDGKGLAADMQLPAGISHVEAIAKIRAAGLPVDQFEADGGALHVGFKPVGVAGRNMVIPSATLHDNSSVASMTGGPLTSYQLEASRPHVLALADALADQGPYKGNADYKAILESRAMTQLETHIRAAKGLEDQYGQEASAALASAQLMHSDPASVIAVVGQDSWNHTTPLQHRQLIAQATNQSNQYTPALAQEIGRLDAEASLAKAGTSDAFLHEDLLGNPLLNSRIAAGFLKTRGDILGGRAVASGKETAFNQAWGSEDVTSALSTNSIVKGSPEEQHIAGVLHGEISHWIDTSPSHQPPTAKDVQTQILPKVWLAIGKNPQASTLKTFSLDAARQTLALNGNVNPTEMELAEESDLNRRITIEGLSRRGVTNPTEAVIYQHMNTAIAAMKARMVNAHQ